VAVPGSDGLLRAATYWRSAEFFARDADPDPRGRDAYEAGVGCFADADALMTPAETPVRIPFEGTALNGYLYRPPRGGPQATLIMHTGFDGWAGELHHTGALAAQQRGCTVITFDGPGQHAGRDGRAAAPDRGSAPVPAHRVAERDEDKIARWREDTWPVIKARRRIWAPGLASKTSPARA
jgi:hypothetical protein